MARRKKSKSYKYIRVKIFGNKAFVYSGKRPKSRRVWLKIPE